jgi:hypothetical protein
MLLIINLWTRLARAYRSRRRFNSWQAIALSTLLVAAAIIPACIVFGAAFPLLDVKLCATAGQYEKSGLLLGQTGDTVYIGEKVPGPRRIVAIPSSRVEEVFLGPRARKASCDKPAGSNTSSADQ